MNTKNVIPPEKLIELTATLLGLEYTHVKEIIDMYEKTVFNHLKRSHSIEPFQFLTIYPNYRAGYRFKSGLDQKIYQVKSKLTIDVVIEKESLKTIRTTIESNRKKKIQQTK